MEPEIPIGEVRKPIPLGARSCDPIEFASHGGGDPAKPARSSRGIKCLIRRVGTAPIPVATRDEKPGHAGDDDDQDDQDDQDGQDDQDETNNENRAMHAGTRGERHPLEALRYTYLRTRKIPG